MAAYDITLHGCDEQLTVTADLSPAELATVQHIASLTELHSGCEPYMTVAEHEEEVPF